MQETQNKGFDYENVEVNDHTLRNDNPSKQFHERESMKGKSSEDPPLEII